MEQSHEAAAFWGSAQNPIYPLEARLKMALKALEFFGGEYEMREEKTESLLDLIEGHAWHAQSRIPGLRYCQHKEHEEMTNGSPVCWKAEASEALKTIKEK